MSGGASPTETSTGTASPSTTPSPTSTPKYAAFVPGNLLSLRVASNATLGHTSGRYVPAFIDEINAESGILVQSVPLPTDTSINGDGSTNYRCTLPGGALGGEGYLQTTTDGYALTFGCYDGAPGQIINHTTVR